MEILTKDLLYQKTPQELTAFLYEGAIDHLETAKQCIIDKQFLEANERLQKVSDIIHRLGVGLKYEAGPIAEQLDSLYNFTADLIIRANRKKDTALIDQALKVIIPIASAWNTAMKSQKQAPSAAARRMSAYESQIMRETTQV